VKKSTRGRSKKVEKEVVVVPPPKTIEEIEYEKEQE
jgi:hypothetical protein